ncbi:MAG: type II toxin-antitoxin system VapC family toxin [Promethearchaeota archaeon]
MKKIIVDSCYWITAFAARDKYHKIGKKFLRWLKKQEKIKILITDFIIIETLSFIRRKADPIKANEVIDFFLKYEKIEIYYNDEEIFNEAIEIFKKYTKLSLVDCTIVIVYLNQKCDYLLSYDYGFDTYQEIIRFEQPQ